MLSLAIVFFFFFFYVENYESISISTFERPKQLGTPDGEFLLIALNVFEKSYMEDNLFSCFKAQSLEGVKEVGYLGSLRYLKTPTLLMLLLSWQLRAPQEC